MLALALCLALHQPQHLHADFSTSSISDATACLLLLKQTQRVNGEKWSIIAPLCRVSG